MTAVIESHGYNFRRSAWRQELDFAQIIAFAGGLNSTKRRAGNAINEIVLLYAVCRLFTQSIANNLHLSLISLNLLA